MNLFDLIFSLTISLEHGSHYHGGHHHNHNESDILIDRDTTEDINLRAAVIHAIGDLLQSIGVLIASGIIWYNEDLRIADPICTLIFSLVVIISTIFITRDILRILMEGIYSYGLKFLSSNFRDAK